MDPQSQHAADTLAGLGIGFILFGVLIAFAILAFFIFCLWRIFTKAGLSGALSLLIFIPFVGSVVVLCVLAFAEWKVVPVQIASPYLPPVYPPPPPPLTPPPPSYPTTQV